MKITVEELDKSLIEYIKSLVSDNNEDSITEEDIIDIIKSNFVGNPPEELNTIEKISSILNNNPNFYNDLKTYIDEADSETNSKIEKVETSISEIQSQLGEINSKLNKELTEIEAVL